ncbi:hypothetical protein [Niveispirillum cyanobacteriorum]|uniref:Uncharacterized protein n=1 Tax=Niveispirillum cyanobacteriorum TaxID=1612173 RepID=A0A2K9NKF7_9PROT|nr:hypothetical protein [Niveispirillum cyanobacteriorum]AUN33116.1 hypothetical protein C0V82_22185 [Niveispirillum cyanobacteriorum]GGE89339.1 hypothetical protein GCM10011317_52910 [Niveispirillum cyanobacteriorum]
MINPTITARLDKAFARLDKLQPNDDPAIPAHLQYPYAVMMSAIRIDGNLQQAAIAAALSENQDLIVLCNPDIYIPQVADQFVDNELRPEALQGSLLYYCHGVGRKTRPDMVIADKAKGIIDIIEIKRGLGKNDAGKSRQTLRDLRCLGLIGVSYARSHLNVEVSRATAALCSIYGASTLPPDLMVSLEDLEMRYGIDIRFRLKQVQMSFKERLDTLLCLKSKAASDQIHV